MPLIEEIVDDTVEATVTSRTSTLEFKQTLKALSARMALPEDLLPSFLAGTSDVSRCGDYHDHALSLLRQISTQVAQPTWHTLEEEEQVDVLYEVLRLYGPDPWSSSTIHSVIDHILKQSQLNIPDVSLSLLRRLRSLFSNIPHPMLNEGTSRALSRPAGGKGEHEDFHDTDTQSFKLPHAWGTYNILRWASSNLPVNILEKNIGLVLPPTLVMMDDWEPQWRARGVYVLDHWMDNLNPEIVKRMGVDQLLRSSLIHTMSLHSYPPLPGILPVLVRLLKRTMQRQEMAEAYTEVVEKGIINGWTYAPSGIEGRQVLIAVAADLGVICEEMGEGIVRWLKTIIPNLLDPLQYIPTAVVLPHYKANLAALACVVDAVEPSGRIARWRGQIIDVLSRLWIQLKERGDEEKAKDAALAAEVLNLIARIFAQLAKQVPTVCTNEFPSLLGLEESMFRPLIPTS